MGLRSTGLNDSDGRTYRTMLDPEAANTEAAILGQNAKTSSTFVGFPGAQNHSCT